MLNKKAISAVVTTVLIILISIAAVIILWVVIRPMIEQTGNALTGSCLDVQLEVTGCDTTNNRVTVRRGAGGGDIAGVTLLIQKDIDDVPTAKCIHSQEVLETHTFGTTATGKDYTDCTQTLATIGITTDYEIDVAAIITLENGEEQVCNPSGTPYTCS
ncbi:MAG: hypothetical protein KKF56_00565 [Nanoarchaeota archaeon]|nr:hypothetical protein [Nanoarchaeota archaeon]